MTLDLETVVKAVEGWSVEDRRELIDRLADGLPDENGAGPEVTPELLAELDRRIADIEANPDDVYTWDEVMAYVKRPKS